MVHYYFDRQVAHDLISILTGVTIAQLSAWALPSTQVVQYSMMRALCL
jgi:hypothetical protein